MKAEEKIREILYGYEEAGLIACDPVRVLAFLSDDVIGIGMGEQGFVSSKKEISDIMLATVRQDPAAAYSLDIQDIAVHRTTEDTASLCAKVYVKRTCEGEETVSGFMQSLSLVRRNGEWLICALHASPIMLSEETIEGYPLRFADSTLAKLKAELQQDTFALMNRNFSGGIMGIYANEPYELYFANDVMIKMLGYEREEFEQRFGKDIRKLFYPAEGPALQLSGKIDSGEDFFSRARWKRKDGADIWVEICTRRSEDDKGNAVLISIVTDVTELVTLQMETEKQNKTILSSIRYSSKIQRNLLPPDRVFEKAFTDYAVLWSPKAMVGGDIYWLKQFEKGSVLVVGDCTGHGVPGALLTMLVVSILDNVVKEENCAKPAEILYQLDRDMAGVLNAKTDGEAAPAHRITNIKDGCDAAALFIGDDGSVKICASGMYIFICDGKEVRRIRGQKLGIGEGLLEGSGGVDTVSVPACSGNRFYVASDGLFDQIGGEKGQPYGFRRVKEIVLQNHQDSPKEILGKLWNAFEGWRGANIRRDDLEMITFIP